MNTKLTIIAASALAFSLSACDKQGDTATATANVPKGPIAPPAGQEWTDVVAESEAVGYVMGNPGAPVKLIEYGSLSCPACAKFSLDSSEEIRDFVKSGRVSFEYRPLMVHPQDPTLFVVARCNGPQPFFALADQIYRDQESMNAKLYSLTQTETDALKSMPPIEISKFFANKMELPAYVETRGIPRDKVNACLADPAAYEKVDAISKAGAGEYGVTGTPTFILNGKKVENANSWAAIKEKLIEAGGGV